MTLLAARRPHLVLVEDSPDDRHVVQRWLRRNADDCLLETWPTGEAFLRAVGERHPQSWWPSVIVLDVDLGGCDGIEVLGALKRSPWALVPALVLSGSAQADDVERAYRAGAAGFFTKPVGREQIDRLWSTIDRFTLRLSVPPRPRVA